MRGATLGIPVVLPTGPARSPADYSARHSRGAIITLPKLYRELAAWWPLLSAPDDPDYAREAAYIRQILLDTCAVRPRTLLELGSGGGNNASHLKAHFQLTLVDPSAGMLAVSRALNPQCEHIEGDMRAIRLGRQFDGVLIHDAIAYMTTPGDLCAALRTAFVHCRPGGAAVFMPDYVRETFRPSTDHGGEDGERRSLRYLEWTTDPDPADSTYITDYAYLLREADGSVHVEHDRHVEGLFARADWLAWLREAGFKPRRLTDPWERDVFVGAVRR